MNRFIYSNGRLFKRVLGTVAVTLLPVLYPLITHADSQENKDTFEQDRKAILSMAGAFQVEFQFDEVATFSTNYTISKPHRSGAMELVKVIDDRGDFISLQHVLVVGKDDSQQVIKHWRQDWQYEPETIWAFIGNKIWSPYDVEPETRTGAWSQTVYQVDDGPRYASVSRWQHEGGQSMWESGETWRPLPRREHTIRDDYDVLVGTNRHVLTHNGWVHQQDNQKVALRNGGITILAREIGVNTYKSADDVDLSIAEKYWDEKQDFWSAVRNAWKDVFYHSQNVRILEVDDSGVHLGRKLHALSEDDNNQNNETDDIKDEIQSLLANYVEYR